MAQEQFEIFTMEEYKDVEIFEANNEEQQNLLTPKKKELKAPVQKNDGNKKFNQSASYTPQPAKEDWAPVTLNRNISNTLPIFPRNHTEAKIKTPSVQTIDPPINDTNEEDLLFEMEFQTPFSTGTDEGIEKKEEEPLEDIEAVALNDQAEALSISIGRSAGVNIVAPRKREEVMPSYVPKHNPLKDIADKTPLTEKTNVAKSLTPSEFFSQWLRQSIDDEATLGSSPFNPSRKTFTY